jgi:hypothetical protein
MVNDLGAAVNGALVVLGDRLGIYTALADNGPATSEVLAQKTALHERQLREWLCAQAASALGTLKKAIRPERAGETRGTLPVAISSRRADLSGRVSFNGLPRANALCLIL